MKEMKEPATAEKFKRGPVGMLTVVPSGAPAMGKQLGQWFLYCIVISIFAAYLTGRTRMPGTEYLEIFRVAGCTAFLPSPAARDSQGRGAREGVDALRRPWTRQRAIRYPGGPAGAGRATDALAEGGAGRASAAPPGPARLPVAVGTGRAGRAGTARPASV